MSKAPAKQEAAAEGEAPPKKSKKLIIILAIVILLAAGGGGAAFFLMKKKHADNEEEGGGDPHAEKAKEKEKEPPKVNFDPTKPPIFVKLDPFTVNLQPENGDHYLQISIFLRVSDQKLGDQLKLYMPELRHRINLLLAGKKPSELGNPEGRELCAEEIKLEANDVLGFPPPKKKRRRPEDDGPIIAVLFDSLIIQ